MASSAKKTTEIQDTALFGSLKSMLDDTQFLPKGGRLAFGLSYEYPAMEMENARVFNAILKGAFSLSYGVIFLLTYLNPGSDNLLWLCLTAFGLEVEVKAAYKLEEYKPEYPEDDDEDEDDDDSMEEDDPTEEDVYYGRTVRRLPSKPKVIDSFSSVIDAYDSSFSILMTASSFVGVASNSCEGDYGDTFKNLLKASVDAKIESDLIWVTRPSKFAKNENFASYGNEPSTNCSYVAGALVVCIVRGH